MANDNKTIQRLIDQRIEELGTSRNKVQQTARVGSTYIRDLAKGNRYDSHAVTRIAQALGLSATDLMGLGAAPANDQTLPETDYFSEDDVRRAVVAAMKGTTNRDPIFLADLIMTFLKANALVESDSKLRA